MNEPVSAPIPDSLTEQPTSATTKPPEELVEFGDASKLTKGGFSGIKYDGIGYRW